MKYWIFINHQLQGPYDNAKLRELPEFRLDSQVCLEGDDVWHSAKMFPELLNPVVPSTVIQSGDYAPGNPAPGRRVEDWREAIIPTNFEEAKIRVPNPTASAKPAAMTRAPASSLLRAKSSGRKLGEIGRSTWAMMALWTLFFGLYIPQSVQVDQIVDGLIANSYTTRMSNRMRGHRASGKEKRLRRQKAKARLEAFLQATKAPSSKLYKDLKSSESVMEEDSTDLGHGMELKTVVTLDEKNGQKTWKTHRYLRAKPGASYEPM